MPKVKSKSKSSADAQLFFSPAELKRMQNSFDLTAVFILILDRFGRVVLVNRAGRKMIGYTRAEMIGKNWFDHFLLRQNIPAVKRVFRQIMSGRIKSVRHYENAILTKQKREKIIRWYNTPLIDARGNIYAIISSGTDVTSQLEITRKLKISENKYRKLFEGLVDSVVILDLKGNVVDVNQVAVRESGYQRQELIGHNITRGSNLPPDSKAKATNYLRTYLSLRKNQGVEIETISKRGTRQYYRLLARPVIDAGKLVGHQVTMHNITASHSLAEKERARQRKIIFFQKSLLEIGRIFFTAHLDEDLARILEKFSVALGVERVGLWFYTEYNKAIYCADQYVSSRKKHEHGTRLLASHYPVYFRHLAANRVIAADDAQNDRRTKEFTSGYLKPLKIISMMDVPIRLHGRVIGIICCESVGASHYWTPEEQAFSGSVADHISLRIETDRHEEDQRSVARSERELQALIKSIPDLIFVLDRRGRFVKYYAQDPKSLFAPPDKFLGKTIRQVFPPALRRIINPVLQNVLRRGGSRNVEYEIPFGSTKKSFSTSICAQLDQTGKIVGATVVARDITSLRQMTEILKKSEEKYRSLYQSSADGIASVDLTGRITEANQAFCDLTGYSLSELRRLTYNDLTPPKWHQIESRILREQVARRGFSDYYEKEYIRRDKTRVPVSLRTWVLRDARGKIVGFWAIVRDITKIKETLTNLEITENRYRRLFETAQDGVLLLNADTGLITEANPYLESILGYPQKHFVGKRLWELGFFQDKKLAQKTFQILQKKGYVRYDNLPLLTRDGRQINTEFVCNVYTENHTRKVIQCNVRDITERARADRAKTEFISLASHQLRTPLTALNWYSEMLSEDTSNLTAAQKAQLNEIIRGSQQMVGLIDSLLDVSRLELRSVSVKPKRISPAELTKEIIKDFWPSLKDKSLQLATNYDPKLELIQLDPDIYRHILQNLLSNAIKYTPARGKITLSLSKQGSEFLLSVADTGCGIPADQQSDVFNKLWRADNAAKIDPSGQGLGLYIVKQIMESTGGRIWFRSKENQGSTFFVTWPLSGMKAEEGKPLNSLRNKKY